MVKKNICKAMFYYMSLFVLCSFNGLQPVVCYPSTSDGLLISQDTSQAQNSQISVKSMYQNFTFIE